MIDVFLPALRRCRTDSMEHSGEATDTGRCGPVERFAADGRRSFEFGLHGGDGERHPSDRSSANRRKTGPTGPADRVEFEAPEDDRGDFVSGLMRADESSRLTRSSITPGRGQTTQDFAVGVGVFLIAIALVVALLPTFVTPFDAGSGGDTAKADRIAATIVDAAGGERPNELAVSTYEDSFVEASDSELRRSLALTSVDAVNVSLVELESGTPVEELQLENDAPYEGQPAASVTRIVVLDEAVGGVDACDPACELTVRVW